MSGNVIRGKFGGLVTNHTNCTLTNNCLTGFVPDHRPHPREPCDLETSTLTMIHQEIEERQGIQPDPVRIVDPRKTERYQAELRDLARRQVAASRARADRGGRREIFS